jgi:hypothetical protein
VSALAIWGFALWSLRSTLNLSYNPLEFWGTLSASLAQGLTIGQAVPALLMLVLIVATPLVIWNLLEEWAASYTPTDEGLRFTSLGISLLYPWDSIEAVQRVDDDSDDPFDEVLLREDYTGQIGNPLLRWLHAQAYGRRKLPIYAGIEQRNQLLAEIKQRAGLLEYAEEPAPASATV